MELCGAAFGDRPEVIEEDMALVAHEPGQVGSRRIVAQVDDRLVENHQFQ